MLRYRLHFKFKSIVGARLWAALCAVFISGCTGGGTPGLDDMFGAHDQIGDSAFTAAPSNYNFGSLPVNTSAQASFQLTNSAKSEVSVSSLTVSSAQFTLVSDTCPRAPSALAPGMTCTAIVQFLPTIGGLQAATLQVAYNVGSQGLTSYSSNFGVSGVGVSPLIFAGLQSISAVTHNTMMLNWAATPIATSFLIFRISGGVMIFDRVVVNTGGTVTSVILNGLTPSTAYTWRVRGLDTFGNSETNTADRSASTLGNIAPSLAVIGSQTAYQGILATVNANDSSTGTDTDGDGDTISYTCYFDTSVDGSVNTSSACTTLLNQDGSAVAFNSATGSLPWTPPYAIAPGTAYEFRITGSDPYAGVSSRVFVTTVQAGLPILAHTPAGNFTFPSGYVSTTQSLSVDFINSRTGSDSGVTAYACTFDRVVDGAVAAGTNCSSLPGSVSFNITTGVLTWTPSAAAWGAYEIRVSATNPAGTATEFLIVDLRQPFASTGLLAYWDAAYANGSSIGVNAPLTSTWKNLASAASTYDGTLTGFAANALSGWDTALVPKLVFDGVGTAGTFGNVLNAQANASVEAWINSFDLSKSTIWSYGDSSGKGLTLSQSTQGDGRLSVTVGARSYVEEVLADAPVAYYRLNDVAGPTAYDYSGNALNGTYSSSVGRNAVGTINDGDKAVTLNGANGSINAPYPVGGTVTIEIWAQTTSLASSPMLWRTGPNGSGPDLFFSSNIALNIWDSASNGFCAIPASATDGNFHHYVTVINGSLSQADLYYDGVLCGSAVYRNPTATSVSFSSGLGSYEWNGSYDDVAIYSTALSASRIAAHFAARSTATCRSLGAVTPGFWEHVFASFDGSTRALTMAINGQDQCSAIHPTAANGSAQALTVGSSASATGFWKGAISEMRAYSNATVANAATNFSVESQKHDSYLPMQNLRLWLRADTITRISDGAPISLWPDQSSTVNHAATTTLSRRPTYLATGLNGQPAVSFNGSNCLTTSVGDALDNYTAFVVFKDDGVIGDYERVLDKDFANGLWIGRTASSPNTFQTGFRESSGPYGITSTFADSSAHVVSTRRTGSLRELFADGGTPVSNSVGLATSSTAAYGVGCWYNDNASQTFGGLISEVLVYNSSLSNADRVRVEKYLGAKYGITIP